jgi:membrane protease YdiL (CAAX protease family)
LRVVFRLEEESISSASLAYENWNLSMTNWLRSLSPTGEVVLVTTMVFGIPIWISVSALMSPTRQWAFSNSYLVGTVLWELVLLGLVAFVLNARGWTIDDIQLRITWKATATGLLLFLVVYALIFVLYNLIRLIPGIGPVPGGVFATFGTLSFSLVLLASFVNSSFEELLVVGYLVTAVERTHNIAVAVNISVAIRLLYHLYQGPSGMLTIVPLGLVFVYAYVRLRNLWPLIVAHALFDILGIAVVA